MDEASRRVLVGFVYSMSQVCGASASGSYHQVLEENQEQQQQPAMF